MLKNSSPIRTGSYDVPTAVTTSLQSPKYGYHVVKSHLLRHPWFFSAQNWSLPVFNRCAARFNIDLYHLVYVRAMKYQSISAWFVLIDGCGKVPVTANRHFGRSIRWRSRWVSPQWFCGENLQSSLHLMSQIWWKPLLRKMCQYIMMRF